MDGKFKYPDLFGMVTNSSLLEGKRQDERIFKIAK
jgi:hypothetical protein